MSAFPNWSETESRTVPAPIVFEGSANLRTNRNREQLTAIRDRQLHDWHAGWIDDMVEHAHEEHEG